MDPETSAVVELGPPRIRSPTLSAAPARYESIALMVNKLELERFAVEARSKLDLYEYTVCGEPGNFNAIEAMNYMIYEAAGLPQPVPDQYRPVLPGDAPGESSDFSGSGKFIEGTWHTRKQLTRRPESFYGSIPGPLHEPLASNVMQEQLESLKLLMRGLAATDTGAVDDERPSQALGSSLELPDDMLEVYSMTNGVEGAGVPSETSYLNLIFHLMPASADRALDYTAPCSRDFLEEQLNRCRDYARREGHAVAAAWLLGRDGGASVVTTWYIFSKKVSETSSAQAAHEWRWRIFMLWDFNGVFYDSLKDYLDSWTEFVQHREGGALLEYQLY